MTSTEATWYSQPTTRIPPIPAKKISIPTKEKPGLGKRLKEVVKKWLSKLFGGASRYA